VRACRAHRRQHPRRPRCRPGPWMQGRPTAQLTADQALLAQQLYDGGHRTVQQIADIFSVPRSTIYGHLEKASRRRPPRASQSTRGSYPRAGARRRRGLAPLSVPLFLQGLVAQHPRPGPDRPGPGAAALARHRRHPSPRRPCRRRLRTVTRGSRLAGERWFCDDAWSAEVAHHPHGRRPVRISAR